MWPYLTIIGSAAIFIGSLSYIRQILRGEVKPNRVTWLLWAVSPIVAAAISWSSGSSFWEGLPVFMGGFMPLLIFISTFFNTQAYWKLSKFDYICGICASLAIIFWLFASAPVIAMFLAIFGDIMAGLPTIRKAWFEPQSESSAVYVLGGVSTVIGLLILPSWNFINAGFLLAMLAQGIVIVSFIIRGKIKANG